MFLIKVEPQRNKKKRLINNFAWIDRWSESICKRELRQIFFDRQEIRITNLILVKIVSFVISACRKSQRHYGKNEVGLTLLKTPFLSQMEIDVVLLRPESDDIYSTCALGTHLHVTWYLSIIEVSKNGVYIYHTSLNGSVLQALLAE